jgi:hypothetical protein
MFQIFENIFTAVLIANTLVSTSLIVMVMLILLQQKKLLGMLDKSDGDKNKTAIDGVTEKNITLKAIESAAAGKRFSEHGDIINTAHTGTAASGSDNADKAKTERIDRGKNGTAVSRKNLGQNNQVSSATFTDRDNVFSGPDEDHTECGIRRNRVDVLAPMPISGKYIRGAKSTRIKTRRRNRAGVSKGTVNADNLKNRIKSLSGAEEELLACIGE